jgi:hypothetical protein
MLFQLIYDSIGFDKKMIVGRFVVLCAPVLSFFKKGIIYSDRAWKSLSSCAFVIYFRFIYWWMIQVLHKQTPWEYLKQVALLQSVSFFSSESSGQ